MSEPPRKVQAICARARHPTGECKSNEKLSANRIKFPLAMDEHA